MIDMEAIKKRDENQDDVYAVADRSALLAECEQLREALLELASQRISRAVLASTEPEICRWWQEDESLPDSGIWETDCGLIWELIEDGGPKEHDMAYCLKCGKPLEVVNEEDGDG